MNLLAMLGVMLVYLGARKFEETRDFEWFVVSMIGSLSVGLAVGLS